VTTGTPRQWSIEERAALLSHSRLFARLPDPARHHLAGRLRVKHVPRGRFVFREGQPATALHLLAAGRIKVIRETEDGREVILRMISPGDIFGSSGGWGDADYPASAIATEPATVLQLPAPDFAALLTEHSSVALAIMQELAGRLREAEARIRELQTERVERRIARTLLRLANKTGHRTADGIELGMPLSRQDLADLAGTTLSTASRVLSAWDARGIVAAGRERVLIRVPHQLVAIAEELPGAPDSGAAS
jgi:CRP-like cAMP-binding protein